MSESGELRFCAYCHGDKHWIFSGSKLKDGSKIYVDLSGGRWAGRRCPDCERLRVQAAIRCDSFGRTLVIEQLQQAGYEVLGKTLPLKVRKDGEILTVEVRHAHADGGNLLLDSVRDGSSSSNSEGREADVYALLFTSVRICTAEQMQRIVPNASVYQRKGAASKLRPSERATN